MPKVRIQCQAAAMRQVDCSKFSDPQPRNSCRPVECLFLEQWERLCERSEVGDVRSPRSAGSRRPGTMEFDRAATCRREWPACSRHAASLEASAGYEGLVRCDHVGQLQPVLQSSAFVIRCRLSVCLSVTRVYCDKTTANRITRFYTRYRETMDVIRRQIHNILWLIDYSGTLQCNCNVILKTSRYINWLRIQYWTISVKLLKKTSNLLCLELDTDLVPYFS